MHMQERVDSDVGRQSWEQSPLLMLQGLVPSWSGVRWEAERKGQWLSSGPRRQAHTSLPWTLWGSPPNPALRSSVLQGPWPLGGEQSLTHFHSHLLTCPGVPAAPPGHSPNLCDPHPTAPAPRPRLTQLDALIVDLHVHHQGGAVPQDHGARAVGLVARAHLL